MFETPYPQKTGTIVYQRFISGIWYIYIHTKLKKKHTQIPPTKTTSAFTRTFVPITSLGVVSLRGVTCAITQEVGARYGTGGGVVVLRSRIATHLCLLFQLAVVADGVLVGVSTRVHTAVALVPIALFGVVVAVVVTGVVPQIVGV